MRLIFACQECGTHYLPPEGLRYADGSRASAVWCSTCQATNAAQGVEEDPAMAAIALLAATHAMTAALTARVRVTGGAPTTDRRPSRPAQTARGQKRPTGQRSKLR